MFASDELGNSVRHFFHKSLYLRIYNSHKPSLLEPGRYKITRYVGMAICNRR